MQVRSSRCSSSYEKHPFFAELYDSFLFRWGPQDIPFYVNMARRAKGPVLEIACGTGRVLIPIAREGIEIVGLDSSSRMLSVCREKLSRESAEVGSRVRLLRADMRSFRIGRKFRLAIIPYRSFQLLPRLEDQLACLSRIHRHLLSGERLILDLFNPDLQVMADKMRRAEEDSLEVELRYGRKVLQRQRIAYLDPFKQLVGLDLIFYVKYPNGRTRRLVHRLRLRYVFRFEAEHLLARSGFRVEKVYADYDKTVLRSKDAANLIFVARKE